MVHMVAVHSAQRGTGKSTIVANLATLMAAAGQRVGVIDAHIQAATQNFFFRIPQEKIHHTFNHYLLGTSKAHQVAYDATSYLRRPMEGCVYLIPASNSPEVTTNILQQGYNVELYTDGLRELAETLNLNVLLVDTPAGLEEETLLAMLSIGICDTMMLVLRLDQQDYQNTSVAVDIASILEVPQLHLIINQVRSPHEPAMIRQQIEQTYQQSVAAILPYTNEIAALGSHDLFVLHYPDHQTTRILMQLAMQINDYLA